MIDSKSIKHPISIKIFGGKDRLTGIFSFSAFSNQIFPEFGYVAVIFLISLISLKEILSISAIWEKDLESSFNLGIVPLLISFAAIVAYKIMEIL